MTSQEAIETRAAGTGADHLAAYSVLLSAVFGAADKFTAPALEWRYRDNPVGQVVGIDAWNDGRLCAHYATCPMAARIGGDPVKGLVSLNTATHPEFQGRGLFVRLAEETYSAAADAGFDFVVGVANANSTPGFVRRLGFQLVAPLAAGWLPRPPRRRAESVLQFESAWTEQSLGWRLANPSGRYRAAQRGEWLATWARTHVPLVDCVALTRPVAGFTPAKQLAIGASLFIGLDPRLDLGRTGFMALPQRARPSPLNLIYRPLSARAPKTLEEGAVAFSFLDFDPY